MGICNLISKLIRSDSPSATEHRNTVEVLKKALYQTDKFTLVITRADNTTDNINTNVLYDTFADTTSTETIPAYVNDTAVTVEKYTKTINDLDNEFDRKIFKKMNDILANRTITCIETHKETEMDKFILSHPEIVKIRYFYDSVEV